MRRIGHAPLVSSTLLILVSLLGLLGCGQGGASPAPAAPADLSGTIKVSGAWALYPMMVKWAEEFQKLHPNVRVEVSAGGAGKGVTDALSGLVDIGMVSREIKPEEVAQGAFFVPVVKDAVFALVNEQNPLLPTLLEKGLPRAAFVAVWMNDQAPTWGALVGSSAADKVNVYTRSDACGASETWAKYLGGTQEDLQGIAVYGDPGLAEAVRKDPLGIGYSNLGYAYDAATGLPVAGLRVVPIDVNENGRVDPNEDLSSKDKAVAAVAGGVYPAPPARDENLLGKGPFQGLTLEFVRWILGDGQQYVDAAGYIRLPEAKIQEALEKLGK